MIPTFNFDDPPTSGVIGSKAADLFMQQGAAIAKNIEKRALTAEAQAKAPALATVYADGLSRLAAGDMSGMELLTKARAESVGNPFLTAMTDDATKEGARMAAMHIEKSLAEKRLTQQGTQFDRNLKQEGDQFEATRKDTKDWRQEQVDAREEDNEERRLAARDAQAEREYNDKLSNVQRINAERQQTNSDMANANNLAIKNNQQPTSWNPLPMIPIPEKPVYRSRTYGGSGRATDDPVGVSFGAGVVNPTGRPESKVQQNGPLFSPGEAPPMLPEDKVDPSEAVTTPVTAPVAKPLVNEKQPNAINQQVGGLMFTIPKDDQPKGTKTESAKAGGVTTTYSTKLGDGKNPSEELADALAEINRDGPLGNWIAESKRKGMDIVVDPKKDDKGKVLGYYVFAQDKNGIMQPFSHKKLVQKTSMINGKETPLTNDDGSPMMEAKEVPHAIDEKLADSINIAMKLLKGPMKDKIQVKLAGDDQANKRALTKAINVALNGGDLEEVNKELAMIHGMKSLTQDDIKAVKSRLTRSGKPLLKKDESLTTWIPKEVVDEVRKTHLKKLRKESDLGNFDAGNFLYQAGGR